MAGLPERKARIGRQTVALGAIRGAVSSGAVINEGVRCEAHGDNFLYLAPRVSKQVKQGGSTIKNLEPIYLILINLVF